ncbi:MAG: HAMP domain-containing protein [Deltaproteobacteria bacterium]|nr:HAMP domain-containing protein [Deltaproteobacteria bacterium]
MAKHSDQTRGRWTLGVKLSLLVSALVLGVSATMALFVALRTAQDHRSAMNRQVRSMGQLFGVVRGTGSVRRFDPTLIRMFVEHAHEMGTGLCFVVLLDAEERVEPGSSFNVHLLREAAPSLAARMHTGTEQERFECILGWSFGEESIRTFRLHIKDKDGTTIGKVLFGFSTVEMDAQIRASIWTNAEITLAAFLFGLIGAFLMARHFTRPIRQMAEAMQRVSAGQLEQTLAVTSRDEIGTLASTFNFMTRGLRERERIRHTFARYVSDQVAERILKEQDELDLRGELRKVTVLFLDIRGFTTLSEDKEPREVVSLLNDYFEIIIDIIFRYEGTINKFIGDSIMAIYGAPHAIDLPEARAALTAVEIQRAVGEYNWKRLQEGKAVVNFGIGIHSGEAIAGNIGSARRMEYTVIGRNVNLAQRIEASTREGQILISEATYAKVSDIVVTRSKEAVFMKGIVEPIPLFEVVEMKANTIKEIKKLRQSGEKTA